MRCHLTLIRTLVIKEYIEWFHNIYLIHQSLDPSLPAEVPLKLERVPGYLIVMEVGEAGEEACHHDWMGERREEIGEETVEAEMAVAVFGDPVLPEADLAEPVAG